MVEQKLEPNFLKETGFGQQSGSFQKTMLTVNGQHPVKLISLNLEVTIAMELPGEMIRSEQLFIGDQITTMTLGRKLLSNTNILSLLEMTSIFMDLIGARLVSNLPLTESKLWTSHSIKTCGLKEDSQMVCPIHGEVKPRRAHHSTNLIILSSTSLLEAP